MDSQQLAEIAAEACDDRKAKDIQLIQIEKVSSLTDWIIVAEEYCCLLLVQNINFHFDILL